VARPPISERARDAIRLRRLDVADRLRGRADRLVPPRTLDLGARADFVDAGDELLGHLVELTGLQPHHAVLDVGCGTGRVARPLAGYLGADGSYDGVDVHREAIGWCRRRYGRFANFRFRVADVHHRRLNPAGAHSAAEYRFPYEDGRFDVVVAASVVTHLLEQEAEHQLAEIARVLRPAGRALTTWFLLDETSRAGIAEGRSGLPFLEPEAHVAVLSEDVPEEAVAYDAGWVRERCAEHGLAVLDVRPGSWSGREDHAGFEDVVAVERIAA
jgi:SAM-dependent methyltransferase